MARILPQPGSHVDGVLWRISEADEKHLDFYEGFPRLYGKEPIEVTDHNGQKMTVMVYTMNSPFKECLMPPSEGYLGGIIEGCRQNGLDPGPIREEAFRLQKEKEKADTTHNRKSKKVSRKDR